MCLENFEGVSSRACNATGLAISYSSAFSIALLESPGARSCEPAAFCTPAADGSRCVHSSSWTASRDPARRVLFQISLVYCMVLR